MKHLDILYPDDWHVHFRDEDMLTHTVPATAGTFARALVMPNLKPALTDLDDLLNYRLRILSQLPEASTFTPYMTLYLNHSLSPDTLLRAKQMPFVLGAKLYPQHVTTHSDEGVSDIKALYTHFDIMQSQDLVLQIHGETPTADIFDREAFFIKDTLTTLTKQFPRLRLVLEHISTKQAVQFVQEAGPQVAATITPHHLMYNRNDLLNQGIKPHLYCLPILKRKDDQLALQQAATSGNPKFFAGTDSAPHAVAQKESACGCAGVFSAPYAVAMYAQQFDALGKLGALEAFLSRFGAQFYQLPLNQHTLTLEARGQTIPKTLPFGNTEVVPLAAGLRLSWSVHGQ